METMEYQVGTFQKYRSTRDIRMGSIENFQFSEGDVFQYDGLTLILGDGRKFEMTQLRRAIAKGWFVPVTAAGGGYQTQSAQIQVSDTEGQGFNRNGDRPSKMVLDIQQSDEVEVGSVQQRKEARERQARPDFNKPFYEKPATFVSHTNEDRGDPIINDVLSKLSHAQIAWEATYGERPRVVSERPGALPVVREDSENDGVFVARVERDQEIPMNVAPNRTVEAAPLSRQTFAGQGVQVFTEERDMGQIVTSSGNPPPIQMEAKARVGASASAPVQMDAKAQVGSGGRKKQARQVVNLEGGQEGVAVGRVLSPTVTNFTATPTNTSHSAIARVQQGKSSNIERFASEDTARAGDNLSDVLPEAAVTPTPPTPDEGKLQMIRSLIPDFDWDRNRPQSARVKDALKHIQNRPYMNAILMYETESCGLAIKKAIAQRLGR